MKDVGIQKVFPIWIDDGLNPSWGAHRKKTSWVLFKSVKYAQDWTQITNLSVVAFLIIPEFMAVNITGGTSASNTPHWQNLLGIIANIHCEKWVDSMETTITMCHVNASPSSSLQMCQDPMHAQVVATQVKQEMRANNGLQEKDWDKARG